MVFSNIYLNMACKTSYELHHNFPKIADEAGFTFNTHRPRIRIDWNKIRFIDIENLIRERKFVLIEQHINDIQDCILESEFDVRILDEGVVKMFRLAQLTVEYQQFCRHYLDRSVYVLREEISSLAQDLDVTRKELKERDEEIRKLRRKTKHSYRTPLPYGNDNIASMILKSLSNKTGLFPSCSTGDQYYNKCSYCDKVFLNQLYLKGHISRRHPNVMETPQKEFELHESNNQNNVENTKLRDEIFELKLKLKEMEEVIKNAKKQENLSDDKGSKIDNVHNETVNTAKAVITKNMKDAEVSANNEISVIDKIEEWKKEEQEKYNKEINLLRIQIMETIQSLKDKDTTPNSTNELKIIDQLNTTISKQGSEILALKQELIDSKLKIEKENAEKRKENEAQMLLWSEKAETQAKQYELLLQRLNEVEREAHESRLQAEAERRTVAQLEAKLQQELSNSRVETQVSDTDRRSIMKPKEGAQVDVKKTPVKKKTNNIAVPEANRQTLEKLHQKAQALLNIGSSSSSSSDDSSSENLSKTLPKAKPTLQKTHSIRKESYKIRENNKEQKETKKIRDNEKHSNHLKSKKHNTEHNKTADQKNKKENKSRIIQNCVKAEKNGPILAPVSPVKVIRAKITEEVNNRLIAVGVDPLKSGLPKTVFQKQRMKLQQHVESKTKKNSSHEKVRHSILAYLDSNIPKKDAMPAEEYVSPNKMPKAFSFTSVISNVKSKALSFVKSNDISIKDKRKSLNAEVAKRAMSLLKTPPDSTTSSPENNKHAASELLLETKNSIALANTKHNAAVTIKPKKKNDDSSHRTDSDDNVDNESEESDHKYYKANVQQSSKSIENLIKSPARRPLSANSDYNQIVRKNTVNDETLLRSQSATNISHIKPDISVLNSNDTVKKNIHTNENTSDDVESSENILVEKSDKDKILNIPKQTKGVLKNASSTSSLNKKKVLFDMDAIQMKSLSASPSQSLTEKSDGNEKYELGLINLDGEEWDISSIENEPLQNDTKLQISSRTSPKIAELKQTIESQLARRNVTPSTVIVGGVDLLAGPMVRASSAGGSNTSLGSSILDDSEDLPPVINHKAFVKPKVIGNKDDSELDISEFSADGIASNKNEHNNF